MFNVFVVEATHFFLKVILGKQSEDLSLTKFKILIL